MGEAEEAAGYQVALRAQTLAEGFNSRGTEWLDGIGGRLLRNRRGTAVEDSLG